MYLLLHLDLVSDFSKRTSAKTNCDYVITRTSSNTSFDYSFVLIMIALEVYKQHWKPLK